MTANQSSSDNNDDAGIDLGPMHSSGALLGRSTHSTVREIDLADVYDPKPPQQGSKPTSRFGAPGRALAGIIFLAGIVLLAASGALWFALQRSRGGGGGGSGGGLVSSTPTPSPVKEVLVAVTLSMSGFACAEVGTEEEDVVRSATAALLDGVESEAIGGFDCTDTSRWRRRRALLGADDTVALAFSIALAAGVDDDDASSVDGVAAALAAAVSSGSFDAEVATAAAAAGVNSLAAAAVTGSRAVAANGDEAGGAPSRSPTRATSRAPTSVLASPAPTRIPDEPSARPSPAPTRIPDEPSARPSPAPTPRPTDGGDWSDAAWRSAGEWAGSFETGQSHVVRPVNETRCCCCSLAFYRPAESSIRPRSDDAPLWVGRWCHPPATSERCAVVGRRGRYAPRVTAERELELLFTPSAAGVSGGGGGVPSDADDVRVTAWARGARRLGTLAARPPSALRAALEQALTYDRLSPYSDAARSATLPWDWVVENATLRVGWRRAAAADGGGGDGGLVSATLELRDLAHWSLFTVSRTKVAIFGGVSDVAALDGTITLVTTMLKTLTVRCLPT